MDIHECPICCDIYNSKSRIPKIIPCGHSLCSECLSKLTTNICPECRRPFPSNTKPLDFITVFACIPKKDGEEPSQTTSPVSGTMIPCPHTSISSNNRNNDLAYCLNCKAYKKITFRYIDDNKVRDMYCSDCRCDLWDI